MSNVHINADKMHKKFLQGLCQLAEDKPDAIHEEGHNDDIDLPHLVNDRICNNKI